jgi:hypothetical protein
MRNDRLVGEADRYPSEGAGRGDCCLGLCAESLRGGRVRRV